MADNIIWLDYFSILCLTQIISKQCSKVWKSVVYRVVNVKRTDNRIPSQIKGNSTKDKLLPPPILNLVILSNCRMSLFDPKTLILNRVCINFFGSYISTLFAKWIYTVSLPTSGIFFLDFALLKTKYKCLQKCNLRKHFRNISDN